MTRKFPLHREGVPSFHLDLTQDLNDAQRAAVTCGNGPKLIIAGAGSGKTRTITYRVAYLIKQGVHPSRILLATFTNKAAREMLSRVAALTSVAASKVWGGTFHAIGNRILRQYAQVVGLRSNYTILDEEDQRDLIKVCVTDAHIKVVEKRFPSPGVIQELLSMSFNTQQGIEESVALRAPHFSQWVEALQQVGKRYEAKKRLANAVDYDDLLRFWLILLMEHHEIAKRLGSQFSCILVDEYQDTNTIQAQIVERLSERNGHNLMVVGDDAQSIYAFRGANYDNILRFPERNPNTEIFKLETNYRSTPEILEFTNASIAQNRRQYQKTLIAEREGGALPVVLPVNDVYQEASFIAERILQLRDDGIPLEAMAVLYRAHAHSSMLQAELIRRNIPYEVRSGVRFFEQAHIKDVVAYLKVLDNPFDEIAWRRLWLMIPRIGNVTAARLWEEISRNRDPLKAATGEELTIGLPKAAQPFFQRFQKDLKALCRAREKEEPMELIRSVMETGYPEYLRSRYESSQSRLEDIQQLAIFARQYGTLRRLLSELVLLGELYGQEVTGAGSSETERLILSSIHQAKGLEWRIVFVMRMCEGEFPSDMALRDASGEEEERRVFYVATTRAKDELYITYPLIDMGMRGDNQILLQPSRFLREIGFTLYEQGEIEELSQYSPVSD